MMVLALLAFMFIVLAAVGVVFGAIIGDIRIKAVETGTRTDLSRISYLISIVLVYAGLIASYMAFVAAVTKVEGVYP